LAFSPGVSKGAPGEAKKWPSSKKYVVIPGLTRNPVRHSNFSRRPFRQGGLPRSNTGNLVRLSDFSRLRPLSPAPPPRGGRGGNLRRFAPEVYVSGFRIKSGMTAHFFDCGLFFASPGVHPQPAAKAGANDYSPLHTIAGRGAGDRCWETGDRNSCGASRRKDEPADLRPPYENRPAKPTPGAFSKSPALSPCSPCSPWLIRFRFFSVLSVSPCSPC
jgi:hypothetical protein